MTEGTREKPHLENLVRIGNLASWPAIQSVLVHKCNFSRQMKHGKAIFSVEYKQNFPSGPIQFWFYPCSLRLFISEANVFLTESISIQIKHWLGPSIVVGIATAYRLDGPGIESRWRRDFQHLYRLALRPTQPPVQWIPGLSRG